jgi:NAD(P)-dependent dehydrogenase (short-subunit alcohol dehydrogenase family)
MVAMADKWTAADMPDQTGRIAVVTGANSGLGLSTARELARAGASVIMACRNEDKARAALPEVAAAAAQAEPRVMKLDLADLESVRRFAEELASEEPRLDLLINNAGVMAPPRRETVDGFESQLGTNHLGHFALTGRLLERLHAASHPRVVVLSSGAHRMGWLRFDDLQHERRYNNWLAYGQSKLANLMFGLELGRRAAAAGSPLRSLIAHPGYSATNLQFAGPAHVWERAPMAVFNRIYAQSADMGALPTLFAATQDLPSGTFIGPDGLFEGRGHPHIVTGAGRAYDEEAARRLWEISEELTGVEFSFPGTPAVRA